MMMRRRVDGKLGLTLAVSLLGGGLAVGAWHVSAPQAQAHGEGDEASPLAERMKKLEELFRQVRRQVRDEDQNPKTIELLSEMQMLALQAKGLSPHLDQVPADQQPKMLQAYRLRMVRLVGAMLDTEAALLEARNEDAYELLKTVQTMKTEGHQEFRVDD